MIDKWVEWFMETTKDISPLRLEEICRAERDGRCKVLPDWHGKKVYRIVSVEESTNRVRCKKVKAHAYVFNGKMHEEDIQQIGKTVFMTRGEADAMLKTIKQGTCNEKQIV